MIRVKWVKYEIICWVCEDISVMGKYVIFARGATEIELIATIVNLIVTVETYRVALAYLVVTAVAWFDCVIITNICLLIGGGWERGHAVAAHPLRQ